MAGKKIKKVIAHHNRNQLHMKLVTSDACIACKSRCERGIDYMERMQLPGAVGFGVPCRLKAYRKG